MDYATTTPDVFDDAVTVSTNTVDTSIYLEVEDSQLHANAVASLTPKKARKVAHALIEAAAVAEGRFGE